MLCKPVGELDHDHANIARHRNQHLAEIVRLILFLALVLVSADLGHTIDQLRDLR